MAGAAHGRGLEPGWEGAVDRQEGGWTGGQAGAWAVYSHWQCFIALFCIIVIKLHHLGTYACAHL